MRLLATFLLMFILAIPMVRGERPGPGPTSEVEPIPVMDVENKLGTQMPLDMVLRDEHGDPITLREAMNGKPTLLIFGYFRCPQMCNQVMTYLVDQMRKMPNDLGKEFNVITISIDPLDTPLMAWKWREQYLKQYGREGGEKGWRFLTTKQAEIDELTNTAGFKYTTIDRPLLQPDRRDRKNKEYAHPACVIVLQPEGIIGRYLINLGWTDKDLKYALIDANAEIGDFKDKVMLRCFMSYDATKGRYTMDVLKLTRVVGITTLLILVTFVGRAFWRDRKKPRLVVAKTTVVSPA